MSTNNMAIAIPENFDNLTDEQLMNLTGQGLVGGDSSSVLSRLSINYQAEDENDKPLYKGTRWKKVLKGSVEDALNFVSKKNKKL